MAVGLHFPRAVFRNQGWTIWKDRFRNFFGRISKNTRMYSRARNLGNQGNPKKTKKKQIKYRLRRINNKW